MTKIQGSHEIINGIVYNLQECELGNDFFKCTGFNYGGYRSSGLDHWIYQVQLGSNTIRYYSFDHDKIDLRKFNYQCDDLKQKLTLSSTEIATTDDAVKITFYQVHTPIECDFFLFPEQISQSSELISSCNMLE